MVVDVSDVSDVNDVNDVPWFRHEAYALHDSVWMVQRIV